MSLLFARQGRIWHFGAFLIGRGGANRYVYSGYCGVDGVARQFLPGHIRWGDIQGVEIIPTYISVYSITSAEDEGELLIDKEIHGPEDLADDEIAKYGSVTIDDDGTITITSTTAKSAIYLDLATRIVMGEPSIYVPPTIQIRKFDEVSVTATWKVTFSRSGSSSSRSEGIYMLWVYDKLLYSDYITGSKSGTDTVTAETGILGASNDIEIGAGRIDFGRTVTTITIDNIDFGGHNPVVVPQIIYE